MATRRNSRLLLVLPMTILAPAFAALYGCDHDKNTAGGSASASKLDSNWQAPAAADGSRPYVIDWSCEPKRFDSSAETDIYKQEEYCEWRTLTTDATTNTCQFTTSFDNTRDFYLNSRGETGINSVVAAQELVSACSEVATTRLNAGRSVGHNCAGVGDGNCVAERNSDPEICDKVRFVTSQKYSHKLDFTIDQMPAARADFSPLPLMRLGLLTGLPAGCTYSQADQTEVRCTVPKAASCFSVAGQLRVSVRVLTTPAAPVVSSRGPAAQTAVAASPL